MVIGCNRLSKGNWAKGDKKEGFYKKPWKDLVNTYISVIMKISNQ
jgi:hypothetical protein